jgi:hypothetical protein
MRRLPVAAILITLAAVCGAFAQSAAEKRPEKTQTTQRNPFAAPARGVDTDGPGAGFSADDINLDNVRWEYVPPVRFTGIMSAGGKMVATAIVEGGKSTVVKEGDLIILPNKTGKAAVQSAWIRVLSIRNSGITIKLDDGSVVAGRFF